MDQPSGRKCRQVDCDFARRFRIATMVARRDANCLHGKSTRSSLAHIYHSASYRRNAGSFRGERQSRSADVVTGWAVCCIWKRHLRTDPLLRNPPNRPLHRQGTNLAWIGGFVHGPLVTRWTIRCRIANETTSGFSLRCDNSCMAQIGRLDRRRRSELVGRFEVPFCRHSWNRRPHRSHQNFGRISGNVTGYAVPGQIQFGQWRQPRLFSSARWLHCSPSADPLPIDPRLPSSRSVTPSRR